MNPKSLPAPRSLQEWMERNGCNATTLRKMVLAQTGHAISDTMMSFILRGSRRCSRVNAHALHEVTGVPIKTLVAWPKAHTQAQISGRRSKRVA